jgi:hypothetical protein
MAPRPRSLRIARLALSRLWIPLIVLGVMTSAALACTSPAPTSLSTKLSGGGNEGEEITVPEGTGVKDQASLSGKNVEKATGSIEYLVYSDKECKTLVTKAGKIEFTGGKVPASEEKKLEAGAIYYWQAVYSGDSLDEKSNSGCGKEILTVKVKTSISTSLSAEEEETAITGAKITVLEGIGVKDKAVLSGTKISTATGKVKYSVYADEKCEKLVTSAGEGAVEAGKVAPSEEVKLKKGTYYWQAEYAGDTLHEASKSTCGIEILIVRKFEGPSWLSTVRLGAGEGNTAKIEPDEGGLSFEIGESSVVCPNNFGSENSLIIGSRPARVGEATVPVKLGLASCQVLGAATSCLVTGFDQSGNELLTGEAFVELAGELAWRGTSGQRTIAGALLSGSLSFGVKREVIATLKFQEVETEGCPPNLRGVGAPKVISITGAVFAELLKEEPLGSKEYSVLNPNEQVWPFIYNLSSFTTKVETWEWVNKTYQVSEVEAKAGAEKAGVDAFLRAETVVTPMGFMVG